jgi:hypothetical protein
MAIEGQTITLETRAGATKVNLLPTTKINKLTPGSATDLAANGTIVVSGTRKADGSFDASEISQITADLQALLSPAIANATPNAAATPEVGTTPQPRNR